MSKFLIGTSGWNFQHWRGVFYPRDLPKHDWLPFYASHFDTVELNATFYRFFKPESFLHWYNEVPGTFRFVLKAHRAITHEHLLLNCDDMIIHFSELAILLKRKLGLVLLQLPPRIAYDPLRLQHALKTFPNPKKIVVEFRHEKWLTLEVKKLLTRLGSVFCTVDSPELRLNGWVTGEVGYIRLHGRKNWYDYNYTLWQLKEIAAMAIRMGKKAKKVYIFFNNDYYGYAVKNALKLKELLM